MLPKKLHNKQQAKQYSSQPEGANNNKLVGEDDFIFAESEV